ncbi:kyphoscoliosis peptidase [Plakobranchus ocellatus]|uniref:Kyphoscoliosis peptidase n=1 Tax=Plakobranchus ocellatus TaxID=259542 RepID=A0AAV3YZ08_9GAST|nr:kyphoscoliosis peptidase [Plakobranchus ocellatus]
MGCHTSKSSYALTSNSYSVPVSSVVLNNQDCASEAGTHIKSRISKNSFRDEKTGESTQQLQRQLTKKEVIVPDVSMFHMVDLHAKNTALTQLGSSTCGSVRTYATTATRHPQATCINSTPMKCSPRNTRPWPTPTYCFTISVSEYTTTPTYCFTTSVSEYTPTPTYCFTISVSEYTTTPTYCFTISVSEYTPTPIYCFTPLVSEYKPTPTYCFPASVSEYTPTPTYCFTTSVSEYTPTPTYCFTTSVNEYKPTPTYCFTTSVSEYTPTPTYCFMASVSEYTPTPTYCFTTSVSEYTPTTTYCFTISVSEYKPTPAYCFTTSVSEYTLTPTYCFTTSVSEYTPTPTCCLPLLSVSTQHSVRKSCVSVMTWLTSIPCVLIHGVLKGKGREPASLLRYRTRPNHVWNLVLVKGQWRFVDCACGRGLQDDPKHAEITREFFFLPDPRCLIITHFPLGMSSELLPLTPMGDNFRKGVGRTSVQIREGLQMLPLPLKFGQFCQQAALTVVAMEIGLELMSHKHAHVTVSKGELFSFRSAGCRLSNMAAVLRGRESEAEYKQTVLCTRHGLGGDFRVFVKPSRCGNFRLSVYGQTSGAKEDSFHLLVDYYLKVEEVEGKDLERGETFLPFPEHFGVWGANDLAPKVGFSRRIYKFDVLACRTGDLYLKLPISGFVRTKAVISPAVTASKPGMKAIREPVVKKDANVSLISVHYKSSDGNEGDVAKFGDQILINGGKKKAGCRLLVKSKEDCSALAQYTENVVHIRSRFPERGFYSLSLFAQKSEASTVYGSSNGAVTKFSKVADFLVSCQRASPALSRRIALGAASGPYPKIFPVAQNYQCLLLEPLARDLVLGVTVTFRIRSRLLVNVKVENEIMLPRKAYKEAKTQQIKFAWDKENLRADDDDNDDDEHGNDNESDTDNARRNGTFDDDDDDDDDDGSKEGEMWCLDYTPTCPGAAVCIYGCGHPEQGTSAFSALYMFQVGYLSLEQLTRQRKLQRCTDSDTDTEIISIVTKM